MDCLGGRDDAKASLFQKYVRIFLNRVENLLYYISELVHLHLEVMDLKVLSKCWQNLSGVQRSRSE